MVLDELRLLEVWPSWGGESPQDSPQVWPAESVLFWCLWVRHCFFGSLFLWARRGRMIIEQELQDPSFAQAPSKTLYLILYSSFHILLLS